MADNSNNGMSTAAKTGLTTLSRGMIAKLGVAATVITILTFFGIPTWHDFATKILHVDDGTSSASGAKPAGTSLFPPSFSYGARTFTATNRPDVWGKGGCKTCEAGIGASYTANDDPKLKVSGSVILETDSKVAEAAALAGTRMTNGGAYEASSGRYFVQVVPFNFDILNVSEKSLDGYGVASTLVDHRGSFCDVVSCRL